MAERIFGHIPGYPEGSLFENRAELSESKVHVPSQAGISGSQTEGAESIVLSGGYEDDTDEGDVILYTGHKRHRINPDHLAYHRRHLLAVVPEIMAP